MRIQAAAFGGAVWVDDAPLHLEESLRVCRHSPTGFAWGYSGSGPAQLALAILLRAGIPADDAVQLHQDFKFDTVATWPQAPPLDVDVDLDAWLKQRRPGRGGSSR